MKYRALAQSFLEQGFTSLATLILTAGMIWAGGPVVFGQFIFIFTLILIAASLQFGLIGTPMLVSVRPLHGAARQQAITTLLGVDMYVRSISALVVAICAYGVTGDLAIAATAAVFCWTYLWREVTRNALFACETPRQALVLSCVALASVAILFPAFLYDKSEITPLPALLAGALSNLIAMIAVPLHRPRWPGSLPRLIEAYRAIFPKAGWSFWGSASNEVQTRAHVLIVQATRGVDQLGILEAGRVLFAPLLMMAAALQRVMQPQFAALYATGDVPAARRLALVGAGLASVICALYVALIYLAFDYISEWLFGGRFGDLGPYIVCWAIYTMLLVLNWTLSSFLNAMHAYGRVAVLMASAAGATLIGLCVLLTGVPLITALYVLIVVQTAIAISLLLRLWVMTPPLHAAEANVT